MTIELKRNMSIGYYQIERLLNANVSLSDAWLPES